MSALRIFVRRGAIRRFHRLTRDAAGLPVTVEWDRRQTERRTDEESAATDQRREERRTDPPFTWKAAEFVVVEEDPSDAE